MRRFIILAALLAAFLSSCSKKDETTVDPSDQKTSSNVSTRGVWIYGSTLLKEKSDSIAAKLANNNVNAVYLLVKGTSGQKTPAANLTDFITAAHAKKIKVHLWIAIAQDDNFLASNPDAHVYHCPKPSLGYTSPYRDNGSGVNLLYPGYKQYVLDNIKYFLTNFDCDGIHLDYIRYSHLVYSFDKYQLHRADSLGCNTQRLIKLFNDNYDNYAAGDGFVNLYSSGDSDVVKWVNMRKNIIYDYIKSIKDLITQTKPNVELNAAFMPEGAIDPVYADVYYSQNYSLNSPLLSMISPMAYFKDYNKTTDWLTTVTEKAKQAVDPKCNITMGIQAYNGVTSAQISEQISNSLKAGAFGLIAFRYETITADQWPVIKEKFKL
ncbi:MAG: family 10 glycosylhydrolase [Bacteroidota bacterium]|nr:family 10 glycosylhydrolase [Bacteroidota bacterium]